MIREVMIKHLEDEYQLVKFTDFSQRSSLHTSGATPAFITHPNQVLSLCIECDIESCLPAAYWDVSRCGIRSAYSDQYPLSPGVIKTALLGMTSLRELENANIAKVFSIFSSACNCSDSVHGILQLESLRTSLSHADSVILHTLKGDKRLSQFCTNCQEF